jgi:hypothetical protein
LYSASVTDRQQLAATLKAQRYTHTHTHTHTSRPSHRMTINHLSVEREKIQIQQARIDSTLPSIHIIRPSDV